MEKIINTLYNQNLDKRKHTAPILWDSFDGENKDWREDEFKMWFLDNCIIMSDLDGRAHNVMKFNAIKLYIESILKSKQEEIEKAIDGMKGYVPHLPTIDPSLGELTDQDIGFVEHINGQLLFKREVKPIISNILK